MDLKIVDLLSSIRRKKRFSFIAIFVLITIPVVLFIYSKNQNSLGVLGNQNTQITETQDIIEKVGKLVELPKETPTIASVTDVSKLKDQPFFAKAQNGDKVLVFAKAQKAIIYRPSTNKVIEIAAINTGPDSSSPEPSISQATPTPTINLKSLLKSSPTNTATPSPSP